jgi:hypothetical protein
MERLACTRIEPATTYNSARDFLRRNTLSATPYLRYDVIYIILELFQLENVRTNREAGGLSKSCYFSTRLHNVT